MKLAILTLSLFSALLLTKPAQAGEAVCYFNDCLRSGWSFASPQGATTTRCHNGDCVNQGWTVQDYYGRMVSVVCKMGGCFSAGWVETQMFYPFQTSETLCRGGNCFAHGSDTFLGGLLVLSTNCIGLNCAQLGWVTTNYMGAVQQTQCKGGSCFNYGWFTFP